MKYNLYKAPKHERNMATRDKKKKKERLETLMRIVVLIVSGIVLAAWRYLIIVFWLINFFYSVFSGKRLKELADLSEIWNTQSYIFQRYIIFESNERPFPFRKLTPSFSKFEK